jgi:hypothetical protein
LELTALAGSVNANVNLANLRNSYNPQKQHPRKKKGYVLSNGIISLTTLS